jgi:hypothetical protein
MGGGQFHIDFGMQKIPAYLTMTFRFYALFATQKRLPYAEVMPALTVRPIGQIFVKFDTGASIIRIFLPSFFSKNVVGNDVYYIMDFSLLVVPPCSRDTERDGQMLCESDKLS